MLEKRPVRHPETSLRDLLFQAFDSLDRSAERKQVPSVVAPAQDSIADLYPHMLRLYLAMLDLQGR